MRDLESFLQSMSGERTSSKILPEAAVARLRELWTAHASTNNYRPGEWVTIRPGVNLVGVGEPHIVLESRAKGDELIPTGGEDPQYSGSQRYGAKLNVRILGMDGDEAVAHWVEHYTIEPYKLPE